MNYTISVDEPFKGEFKEEMFPIFFMKARLVSFDYGEVSFSDDDAGVLFLKAVRYAIKMCPVHICRALDDRQFEWLSRRGVDGPSQWIATNRLWVGFPSNCREAVVRIYNLWNACNLPITELKFKCYVSPEELDEVPKEEASISDMVATPLEESQSAVEELAQTTRYKVLELGKSLLDRYAFFVMSAFEKLLAPQLDECLRAEYTRSAIEIILSAGIDNLDFSGEGEQRMVRYGNVPRTFGEDALAAYFREQLSGNARWVSLSELIADIPEITEAWAVPFVEDMLPDAIPIVENGVFGYKLMGRFSWPSGFEEFIRESAFSTWSDVTEALDGWYGEGFFEDCHITRDTFKTVLGYYAYAGVTIAPMEWWQRIRPETIARGRDVVNSRSKKSVVPIDFNIIPLAVDLERDMPIHNTQRQSYGMEPDRSQVEFIQSSENSIRLLAPAGSGKTTTLLFRCKKLLEENPSGRILLLTFTRVAAEELRMRMYRYSEFIPLCGHVDVTTLNAYGYRIVRHAFPQSRLVETTSRWKVFALEKYLREVCSCSKIYGAHVEDTGWMREHSPSLMDFFDTLKTLAIDHEEVAGDDALRMRLTWLAKAGRGPSKLLLDSIKGLAEADWLTSAVASLQLTEVAQKIMPLYGPAAETMKECKALSFEDQKYWAWKVVKMPGMRMERNGYAHIMVDEFQDVNPIDLELVKSLRNLNNASLTIVGDDDQTIFEWRGATPKYIVSPNMFFSGEFTSYLLNVNYRSPQNIVAHAQRLIQFNKERVSKSTEAANRENAQIVCRTCDDYVSILRAILADVNNSAYKSVAVITRKRSHLIPYQILLASWNQEFFAAEDLNVLLSDAFRHVIKMLDIHCSRNLTSETVIELLNGVRTFHLGNEKAEAVKDVLSENEYTTLEEFADGLLANDFEEVFKYGKTYGRKILEFLNTQTVSETLNYLGEEFLGFKKEFVKARDDVFFTDPPFDELAEFARSYENDYRRFIFDLRKTIDTLSEIIYGNTTESTKTIRKGLATKLHLMTGLRTKGKEFDVVYILRADKDVWPNPQAFEAGFEESERRLFYVAMTRARKKLCFTFSHPTIYLREAGILHR